ncbi:MAG: hypothetical protein WC044_14715 [Crocinitomicaceae bacterium]
MKTSLTKVGMIVMAVAMTTGFTSCKKEGCTDSTANNYDSKAKKDDGSCTFDAVVANEQLVTGNITANTTWTSDKIWILEGKVVVNGGATLTIQAGTIIKGKEGSGTLASALIIAKGAKINAVGTATAPIIFTSVLDNIKIGEITGTNLTNTDKGKWGGLIILGNAKISAASGDVVSQIEGIPASDTYGSYGGADDADNSGVLKFVSIRHGGALIGAGNEINGLTLGGVGSGTVISDIEIVANVDDGVEFFGGTVSVDRIICAYGGDDGIDIDQNYAGTITNFMVIEDAESDKGLEIDGTEGTTYLNGMWSLTNGKVYSKDGGGRATDFKDKAQGTLTNVLFSGFTNNKLKVRASYQSACGAVKTDACSHLIMSSPKLVITGCEAAAGIDVYTTSTDGATTPTTCTVFVADQTSADAAVSFTTTTGGVTNALFSWGWVQANNKF